MTLCCISTLLIIILLTGTQHVCGELDFFPSREERRLNTDSRIVGGTFADRKRYPYYTYLEVTFGSWWYSYSISCGGTMIARDVVLTAAHCLTDAYGYDVSSITAYVNRTSKVETSSHEYKRSASVYFAHQDYDSETFHNDIGLVLLDVTIPTSVPLVNLNRDSSIPATGQSLMAFGLGLVKNNGYFQTEAEYLMEVAINTVSHAACNAKYQVIVDDYTICAGDLQGACQGDSGGPLARLGSSAGKDVQFGVTSFGSSLGCGVKGYPNGFTRVSYYVPWIESIVCKESKSKPAWCQGTTPSKTPTRKPSKKLTRVPTRKLTRTPTRKTSKKPTTKFTCPPT